MVVRGGGRGGGVAGSRGWLDHGRCEAGGWNTEVRGREASGAEVAGR